MLWLILKVILNVNILINNTSEIYIAAACMRAARALATAQAASGLVMAPGMRLWSLPRQPRREHP